MSKKILNSFLFFSDRRNTIIALIFSLLFIFVNMMGYFFAQKACIGNTELFLCFCVSLILLFPISELLLRFKKIFNKQGYLFASNIKFNNFSTIKYYWFVFAILFVFYFIVFLAYYPGIFAYDVNDQLIQSIENYNTMQPLIHTLLLQSFYNLGKLFANPSFGIALYSILQMIIFTMCISYVHLFLYKIKVKNWIRYIIIGFSCVLPFFSLFSIAVTKDVLFAAFFATMTLCLYILQTDRKKISKLNIFIFSVSVIFVITLRNNGLIAVVICLFAAIFINFNNKKIFLKFFIAIIAITFVVLTSLYISLKVNLGTINESLSIPYQQLAYVYNNHQDSLSQKDIENIETIVPTVKDYNPHYADPVKDWGEGYKDFDYFFKTWISYFFRYPVDYIVAFINNNLGYFYLFDNSYSEIYGTNTLDRFGVIQTNTMQGYGVEHLSLLPILENFYEWLYTSNNYLSVPILNILCSPALYLWLILLFIAFCIMDKKAFFIAHIFVLSYIITILLGPCCLLRYALPYILCVPIVMFGYARNFCNNLKVVADE